MRDHAHTLSDFRVPTLSIECEPCGRFGRYAIARLIERYGDAKLPELLSVLARLPEDAIGQRPRPMQGGVRKRQPLEHVRQHQALIRL